MKKFDGVEYSSGKSNELKTQIESSGINPKLVSIVVGNEKGAIGYQNLKKKALESVGGEYDLIIFDKDEPLDSIKDAIRKANSDESVHGVMIQLPLPVNISQSEKDDLIDAIKIEKDVDGMRDESRFMAPVVKAVMSVMEQAMEEGFVDATCRVAIVGADGFVGRKTLDQFEFEGFDVSGFDIDSDLSQLSRFDVVVSCTGIPSIITPGMVKGDSVLIDVGYPDGDFEESAYEKAAFVSPVPGGIGPVTIVMLISNLVESAILSN